LQEEFYFALPYQQMDLALYARDNAVSPADAAESLGLTLQQAEKVYQIIDAKRKAAHYLHLPPLKVVESK
jgi:NAD+ synthase